MIQILTDNKVEYHDRARIEISMFGYEWFSILQFKMYMDHEPTKYMTIWWHPLSKYLGTYTPPNWLLNLLKL